MNSGAERFAGSWRQALSKSKYHAEGSHPFLQIRGRVRRR